jgi:hypothetical protein
MKKASEYCEHAKECRDLAAKMENAAQKAQLLSMAETWEGLAQDRKRFVERHPELTKSAEKHKELGEKDDRRV